MAADVTRLADLTVGSMVGKYRLEKPLPLGGPGVLFEARATNAAPVLLRVVEVDTREEARRAALDRFRADVRLMQGVRHPNLAQVHDGGVLPSESHALAFFTTEAVEGRTLEQLVKQSGPHAPQAALKIIQQAAAGLDRAHMEGVTHGVLKTTNILVTSEGRVVAMDFGVSALVDPVADNVRYAAPEQWARGPVDPRSDVFALGALLFYLLAGVHLRASADAAVALKAARAKGELRTVRESFAIAADTKDVLATALALEPDERFESAHALAEALEATALVLGSDKGPNAFDGENEGTNPFLSGPTEVTRLEPLRPSSPTPTQNPAATSSAARPPIPNKGEPPRATSSVALPPIPSRCEPPRATSSVALPPIPSRSEPPRATSSTALPPMAQAAPPVRTAPPLAHPPPVAIAPAPGMLGGAEYFLCPQCEAEFASAEEVGLHQPACPGAAWQKQTFGAAPATAPPSVPPTGGQPPALASLELDLDGSNATAKRWMGREERHRGIMTQVAAFYSAAAAMKDRAVGQKMKRLLDHMAPLSVMLHDTVATHGTFEQAMGRVLAVASHLTALAGFHESLAAAPRRQPVARLEARLAELTSGNALQDRQLVAVVTQALEEARVREAQIEQALARINAAAVIMFQMQEPLVAISHGLKNHPRADVEAAVLVVLQQLESAIMPPPPQA